MVKASFIRRFYQLFYIGKEEHGYQEKEYIDNADEEPCLFQRMGYWAPIHSDMLHNDSDIAANLSQTLYQVSKLLSGMVDLGRRQDDISAGSAYSDHTLPLKYINANSRNNFSHHQQSISTKWLLQRRMKKPLWFAEIFGRSQGP